MEPPSGAGTPSSSNTEVAAATAAASPPSAFPPKREEGADGEAAAERPSPRAEGEDAAFTPASGAACPFAAAPAYAPRRTLNREKRAPPVRAGG